MPEDWDKPSQPVATAEPSADWDKADWDRQDPSGPASTADKAALLAHFQGQPAPAAQSGKPHRQPPVLGPTPGAKPDKTLEQAVDEQTKMAFGGTVKTNEDVARAHALIDRNDYAKLLERDSGKPLSPADKARILGNPDLTDVARQRLAEDKSRQEAEAKGGQSRAVLGGMGKSLAGAFGVDAHSVGKALGADLVPRGEAERKMAVAGERGGLGTRLLMQAPSLAAVLPISKGAKWLAEGAKAAFVATGMSEAEAVAAAAKVGSTGAMTLYGGATTQGGLGDRVEGAFKMGVLGLAAGAMSSRLQEWVAGLAPAIQSKALQRLGSVLATGGSYSTVDALLNGPDGERAAMNFLFGSGLEAMGGAKGVSDRVAAARSEAEVAAMPTGREALPEGTAQLALPQGAIPTPEPAYRPLESPKTPMLPEKAGTGTLTTYPPLTPEAVETTNRTGEPPWSAPPGTVKPPTADTAENPSAMKSPFERPAAAASAPARQPETPPSVEPKFAREDVRGVSVFKGGGEPPKGGEKPGGVSPDDFKPPVEVKERGAFGKALDAAATTKNWFPGRGLDDAERVDPESAAIMARGSNRQQGAKSRAFLIEAETLEGSTKEQREKFDLAYTDSQRRSRQTSFRDEDSPRGEAFREAFPTEKDYHDFRASDFYKKAVATRDALHKKYVQPVNVRGGNLDASDLKSRGSMGEFSNMAPLTQKKPGKSPGGIGGPRVQQSPVAKGFTGHAESYEPSVRAQDERALAMSGRAADQLDLIDSMRRNGTLVDPSAEGATKPAGWGSVNLEMSRGLAAKPGEGVDTGATVKTYWIHPEMRDAVSRFFEQGKIAEKEGLYGKGKAVVVASSLFGPAAAVGHSVFNVAPVAVVSGKTYGIDTIAKTVKYLASPVAFHQAELNQVDIGAAKQQYDVAGPKWVKAIGTPAARFLESFDLASRESARERTEAEIKAGRLPDTLKSRRDVAIRNGNYSAMTQDWKTQAAKRLLNPFLVIGKTSIANASRALTTLVGLGGQEGQTAGGRALAAARILAVQGAYLTHVGLHNFNATGSFLPEGVPFGAKVVTDDDGKPVTKDGKIQYEWGWAIPLGIYGELNWTPLGGVIDARRRGENWLGAAAKGMENMTRKVVNTTVMGPQVRGAIDVGQGRWGRAALESIPFLKTIIEGVKGDAEGVEDSLLSMFRKQAAK